jgi:rhodanese-related sulfurtransferase
VADTSTQLDAEEARRLVASSEAKAIDLRGDEAWEEAHIPGAIHATTEQLESEIDDLPDDQQIIVVGSTDQESVEVAERLRDKGLDAVTVEGGMTAWTDEQLPVQPRSDIDYEGPGEKAPGT